MTVTVAGTQPTHIASGELGFASRRIVRPEQAQGPTVPTGVHAEPRQVDQCWGIPRLDSEGQPPELLRPGHITTSERAEGKAVEDNNLVRAVPPGLYQVFICPGLLPKLGQRHAPVEQEREGRAIKSRFTGVGTVDLRHDRTVLLRPQVGIGPPDMDLALHPHDPDRQCRHDNHQTSSCEPQGRWPRQLGAGRSRLPVQCERHGIDRHDQHRVLDPLPREAEERKQQVADLGEEQRSAERSRPEVRCKPDHPG